jgi:hypothetical protein
VGKVNATDEPSGGVSPTVPSADFRKALPSKDNRNFVVARKIEESYWIATNGRLAADQYIIPRHIHETIIK